MALNRATLAFLLVACVLTGIIFGGAGQVRAAQPRAICTEETARQERASGIPGHLLGSIALLESGRYDPKGKTGYAWPWTVTAEGKGRYLPTKAAAIAEVRALKARGISNIDVGCMQINLHFHPTAFSSLDEAFDPSANVGYAGRFLKGLYESTGSWTTAGSYYHSQTPHLAARYKSKLLATWAKARKNSGQSLADEEDGKSATWDYVRKPETTPQTDKLLSERAEARRIANAYRQARLKEYKLRMETLRQQARPQSGG